MVSVSVKSINANTVGQVPVIVNVLVESGKGSVAVSGLHCTIHTISDGFDSQPQVFGFQVPPERKEPGIKQDSKL